MKKSLRRILATLFALTMIFCSFSSAYAVETDGVVRRAPDEVEKHKLVTKEAYVIQGGDGYRQPIEISAYVTYLYSNVTHSAISFVSIDPPLMTLAGTDDNIVISNLEIHANEDFVMEYNPSRTSVEIRRTVVLVYEVEGVTVSAGIDIVNVSTVVGGCKVQTEPIEIAIEIDFGDLNGLS